MKKRDGFVSNSSSSSYVIRGLKIKNSELAEILGVEEPEDGFDNTDASDLFHRNEKLTKSGLYVMSNRNYFGGDEKGECIVGSNICSLDDGEFTEIPECEVTDGKIQESLIELGFGVDHSVESMRTYVQMISNDNY